MVTESIESKEVVYRDFLQESMLKAGPFVLLRSGREAFRQTPGLKTLFCISFSLCFIIGTGLVLGCYSWLSPLVDEHIWGWRAGIEGWWGNIVGGGIWLGLLVAFMFIAFLCFKLAFLLMALSIDLMIEKVMIMHRPELATPFSLSRSCHSAWNGLCLSLRSLFYVLIFFPLSFIPFIGPFIAFIGISRGAGLDSFSPYILLLSERDKELFRNVKFRNRNLIKSGSGVALLSMIPFIGWIGVPVSMILQSVGFCHFVESRWKNESETALSTVREDAQ